MEDVNISPEITIGSLRMGGKIPVVIQSMTNTDTNNIDATVDQCTRIFRNGADMVRITTQGKKEVRSLALIRKELQKRGYYQPLVADVHFLPAVAEEAAKIVEKVRINPGNYIRSVSANADTEERAAIIRENLLPLVRICKEHDTAIRIGVNHGSLSEWIMNRYGDSPEGMAESAMEFLRVFREQDFSALVVSLKASSTKIMVQANRLLIKKMQEEKLSYPLHLGVTEAGDEVEGRIKSAVGIGSLLLDGIGDTIRVSLTEDPEKEIPVALILKEISKKHSGYPDFDSFFFDPFHYNRYRTKTFNKIGGDNPPVVINSSPENGMNVSPGDFGYSWKSGILGMDSSSSDFIYIPGNRNALKDIEGIRWIFDKGTGSDPVKDAFYLCTPADAEAFSGENLFVRLNNTNAEDFLNKIPGSSKSILVFDPGTENVTGAFRGFFKTLFNKNLHNPVILYRKYNSRDIAELMIRASAEMGSLLLDGFGDGIWLEESNPAIQIKELREISFGILQACSVRISKTEYIACPSCGRTLFNIQSALKKVKQATSGFKGLKIAVMGCIVNGPGEMADADFGYVGAGPGKVTLYKANRAVKKNIPEEIALEELLKLIKAHQ